MQIDSAYDRLEAIGEYIEDTEEYINIELDSSRNRLLRLEIVLTAATFGIAMFGLVAGKKSLLSVSQVPSDTEWPMRGRFCGSNLPHKGS